MGNTDSHSSFGPPAKSSSSLRFSSRKEEVPSARSWWVGSKNKGKAYTNRHTSWNYQHAPKTSRGVGMLGPVSPQGFTRGRQGYAENGGGVSRESVASGGSPKVLFSQGGSMRVAFTTSKVTPVEVLTGATPELSLCTSKGSSLSSEGSWYDSPWGGGESADNVFVCGESITNSSGYASCSSARTEDTSGYNSSFSIQVSPDSNLLPTTETTAWYTRGPSGQNEYSGFESVILQDFSLDNQLYSSRSTLPTFPMSPDADDVIQEEDGSLGPKEQVDSSPHRPSSNSTAAPRNNRENFVKSRMRRLSDWTGSLSRKKRRIEEPYGGNIFPDQLEPRVVSCSALWSSNPLLSQNQNQVTAFHSLNSDSSAQRQKVYDSFMQELEVDCDSSEAERTELLDGEEEEARGGQMPDFLVEQEQGLVRRAGWLSFKVLLTIKNGKLELVTRRKWRRYWVTLKGCTLLCYETYGKKLSGGREPSPRYALLVNDGIVQPIPEHPKREHVFCVSNSHGDVYLFQATNQTDLENWVTAIHSASAAQLARRQGKEDTLCLLRCESRSLLHKIDVDGKMKKMAELQLSVIKELKSRKAVEIQIQQWEQNLEKLNLDLFRLRCYLSSLQGSELPNPKGLLAAASRHSKTTLGRLGVFSVSSFHALVCSRVEVTQRSRSVSGGGARRRCGLPSSLKGLDRKRPPSKIQNLDGVLDQVTPPAGRPAALQVSHGSRPLHLYIRRSDADEDLGFAVMGHVDGGGRSHIFVSEVNPLGLSARKGLRVGDEVLVVNGTTVSGLDLDLMQSLFSQGNLQLLLQRDERPALKEFTTVWPHPARPCRALAPLGLQSKSSSTRSLHSAPGDVALPVSDDASENLELKAQNMDQVFPQYQTFIEGRTAVPDVPRNPYIGEVGPQATSPTHLSMCQHLCKVIQELVDTEKSYVKDLVCLLDVYLTPLQKETFLTKDEMEVLFGSLPEMLDFHRVFLQTLEDRISSCPNFSSLDTPAQFKMLLFSLGGSFLDYADHFKHYSGFCANHIKVQKVLERAKTDEAFKNFLEARNPTNQHSSSLESYLIKPVQRVLKYPLLLRELVSLTDPESPEHTHLIKALRAMEKVASHINEMQKIYEDYGPVFDQLAAEHNGLTKQMTEISMGDFLVQSSVVWLNPLPSLGRLRKEPKLTLFVFKRAVVLVYRDSTKLKKRTSSSRSADHDPFRFRWLIPVSAVQVRPASVTASENLCVWELVHSRSEVEGRPEMVFQLCSSVSETKAGVLRALWSLIRDRDPPRPLRRSSQLAAERSGSWRRQQPHRRPREQRYDPDVRFTPGETCSEAPLPSHISSESIGRSTRLCSLTDELEAQLQRLSFTEGGAATCGEEKRQSSSFQRSPAHTLERDFSIQSMTSIINEDCFYDYVLVRQKDSPPTLKLAL